MYRSVRPVWGLISNRVSAQAVTTTICDASPFSSSPPPTGVPSSTAAAASFLQDLSFPPPSSYCSPAVSLHSTSFSIRCPGNPLLLNPAILGFPFSVLPTMCILTRYHFHSFIRSPDNPLLVSLPIFGLLSHCVQPCALPPIALSIP